MKAKDTVMNPNDATKLLDESFGKLDGGGIDYCGFDIEPLLEHQAEISFKAGFKYALEGAVIKGGYESVKKVGIREVVEWIEKNALREKAILGDNRILLAADWAAQLKEWGL